MVSGVSVSLQKLNFPHLDGYENSKPVRIGNAAYSQRQNDVFGYLLNIIHQYYEFFPGHWMRLKICGRLSAIFHDNINSLGKAG